SCQVDARGLREDFAATLSTPDSRTRSIHRRGSRCHTILDETDPPPAAARKVLLLHFPVMSFPITRLRRMRQSELLRALVRETRLEPVNFIYPLFVCPGERVRKEISSMPGVFNLSVDEAVKEAREAKSLGLGGIILFGLPEKKDEVATGAWADDGIVQRAARALKKEVRGLVVIGDVCLCEGMSHGHCGIVKQKPVAGASSPSGKSGAAAQAATDAEYEVLNDPTLEILAKTAVSLTRAGIDIIAPSDMMDGRVAAIRKALDSAGFITPPILSYAAKFASGF